MKIALFIGKHTKDTPSVRLGWWLTRLVQKGEFSNVTHVEAILAEHEDGSVNIGSASLREKGVRIKENVFLNSENWLIADMPQWDVQKSHNWFVKNKGKKYDKRGAFSSWLVLLWQRVDEFFCSESIVASQGYKSPYLYGPSLLADITFSEGRDVTKEFFAARK